VSITWIQVTNIFPVTGALLVTRSLLIRWVWLASFTALLPKFRCIFNEILDPCPPTIHLQFFRWAPSRALETILPFKITFYRTQIARWPISGRFSCHIPSQKNRKFKLAGPIVTPIPTPRSEYSKVRSEKCSLVSFIHIYRLQYITTFHEEPPTRSLIQSLPKQSPHLKHHVHTYPKYIIPSSWHQPLPRPHDLGSAEILRSFLELCIVAYVKDGAAELL
jgi:hypothetical protein